MPDLTDAEYHLLLTFRNALREFLVWSEREAAQAGLSPQQHQLLLLLRVHEGRANITDVANALQIRHHSAVGLIRRAEDLRLVERERDAMDHRVVRLRLTAEARQVLERLSRTHLDELQRAAALLHISEGFLQELSVAFLDQVPKGYS